MAQEHGYSYGLCKKIIISGKSSNFSHISKEDLLDKLDVLLMSGRLTADDYTELTKEIES